MSNMTTLPHDEARPEMDDLLHVYFQAEMPKPWPPFKTPKPARLKRPVPFWSRYAGRLALAACIALLVASYLTLAGYFPRSQAPTGVERQGGVIGHLDKGKKAAPIPHENPR